MIHLVALLQAANPQLPPNGSGVFVIATVVKMIIVFTIYMVGVALLTLAERKISCLDSGSTRSKSRWAIRAAAAGSGRTQELHEGRDVSGGGIQAAVHSGTDTLVHSSAYDVGSHPLRRAISERDGEESISSSPTCRSGFFSSSRYRRLVSTHRARGLGHRTTNTHCSAGLRSSAQMISYEISMGMSTIPVLLLAGNVTLSTIVTQQAYGGWNVVNLTIAFFIFLVAAFAETNRLPFDLPEAESELIAGYHTEYSAMKFSLFPISEYCNMVTASALMVTLFFGGWDVPFTGRTTSAPLVAGSRCCRF
jgi:NADH-quinone oxidoreductase subunit H